MLDEEIYQDHMQVPREELLVALGCTEPIAIAAVGRMGRVGMRSTDVEILNIMLGN